MSCSQCEICVNPVTIVQGFAKTYQVDLFYADTLEPFDLTSATQIVAVHPGTSGTPVKEYLNTTNTNVTVVGAAGAGKIQVVIPAPDSALLLLNPSPQFQDLQITVTIASVTTVFILSGVLNIISPTYGV